MRAMRAHRTQRRHLILSTVALAALSLAGCDDEAETDSPAVEPATQPAATPDESASSRTTTDSSPTGAAACAVFTEALVRDALELGPDVELTQNESRSHCSYSWEPDMSDEERAELERIRTERARQLMKKLGSGNPIGTAVEMPSATDRVVMHFSVRDPQSVEEAIAAFEGDIVTDREMTMLDENGEETSFVESSERIEGVGDRAAWLSRERSFMVLDEGRAEVFYVGAEIEADADANLPHAKALANALLAR